MASTRGKKQVQVKDRVFIPILWGAFTVAWIVILWLDFSRISANGTDAEGEIIMHGICALASLIVTVAKIIQYRADKQADAPKEHQPKTVWRTRAAAFALVAGYLTVRAVYGKTTAEIIWYGIFAAAAIICAVMAFFASRDGSTVE